MNNTLKFAEMQLIKKVNDGIGDAKRGNRERLKHTTVGGSERTAAAVNSHVTVVRVTVSHMTAVEMVCTIHALRERETQK